MPDSTNEKAYNSAFNSKILQSVWVIAVVIATAGLTIPTETQAAEGDDDYIFGIRLRLGWKYDNIRICGATPKGAPHGPDIDISLFSEIPLSDTTAIDINLPVFRPVMFWTAARLVQFEPEATLLIRVDDTGDTHSVIGPSLGVSVHYGPDLNSGMTDADRGPSFFAIGPRIGGYAGFDFVRPSDGFNFQLGLNPYVTPLFTVGDPEHHRGLISGMTLDSSFRFHSNP